jgi:DNA-binding MarR family transcriptional regulator
VFLRFSEQAARDAGVTPAQHQLLLAVRGFPGGGAPATGDVADMLQQSHHAVVELIDRAEATGLVTRAVDPADGRRRLIGLTPQGEEILAALSSLHRTELRRFRVEMHQVLGELG